MNKLTIEHLAPYVPYGLKVLVEEYGIELVVGIHGNDIITTEDNAHFSAVKPILRPLSYLTKEIEHNGEKFVPLVELFKLSRDNYQQEIKYHCVMATSQIQIEMLGFRNYFFGLYESDRDVRIENGLYFDCYSTDLVMDNRIEEKILCQYSLFQKLFEWHFDVFQLIPQNLAVDINTIKT